MIAAGAADIQSALALNKKQQDTAVRQIEEQHSQTLDQIVQQKLQALQARLSRWQSPDQTHDQQTSDGGHQPLHGQKTLNEDLHLIRQASQDARDAIAAALDASQDERSAITSHSSGRTMLAMKIMPAGLVLVGCLAWLPACRPKYSRYRRFMMQHFAQRLPASGAAPTAPYTLLTSAMGPAIDGTRPALNPGKVAIGLGSAALLGCCIQVADRMGAFNSLAFYLSAATVSSLAGECPAHTCLRLWSACMPTSITSTFKDVK